MALIALHILPLSPPLPLLVPLGMCADLVGQHSGPLHPLYSTIPLFLWVYFSISNSDDDGDDDDFDNRSAAQQQQSEKQITLGYTQSLWLRIHLIHIQIGWTNGVQEGPPPYESSSSNYRCPKYANRLKIKLKSVRKAQENRGKSDRVKAHRKT